MIGTIYKITNIKTSKVYIGQTTINPMKRWADHYRSFCDKKCVNALYNAMRSYGITNFVFQIIETDIPLEKLNEREIYYIENYKSNQSEFGYNLTKGGQFTHNSFLDEETVRKVIKDIKENPKESLSKIGNKYDIPDYLISDINNGDVWKLKDFTYPIRETINKPGKLNENDIKKIISLLKSGTSAVKISKKFKVSNVTIENINNGLIHRQKDLTYPIYKAINSHKNLTLEEVKNITRYLKETNFSFMEIGRIVNRNHHVISNINSGISYKEFLKTLKIKKFPIRQV